MSAGSELYSSTNSVFRPSLRAGGWYINSEITSPVLRLEGPNLSGEAKLDAAAQARTKVKKCTPAG
jgi:hypothetical protein